MKENTNSSMEERLKNVSGKRQIKLPGNIKFIEREQEIEIILDKEAAGKGEDHKNMQEDTAAFEGWAVILYRYFQKNVVLDIEIETDSEEMEWKLEGNGHFNRFLYRVMRFWEQYSWFFLSEKLDAILFSEGGFSDWLESNKENLTNNIPDMPLGEEPAGKEKISENWVERAMAGKKSVLLDVVESDIPEGNEVFRQLPAGLFLNTVKAGNEVFAGKKAAIDLWTWDEDRLYAFEVKYQNKMVGMITEIFFYGNYLNDLLVEKNFTLNQEASGKRGYDHLLENEFEEICACMVADEIHPLIDEEVLEILNRNKPMDGNLHIEYKIYKYRVENEKKVVLDL